MQLCIISIGHKLPTWVVDGFTNYAKRIHTPSKLTLIDIPLVKRSKASSVDQLKDKEAEQILKHLKPSDYCIALDERGSSLSTQALAKQLNIWQQDVKRLVFIIGGPDGLSNKVLSQTHYNWSLSKLTFPHPLVKVILIEQLYRAISINEGHPYHRE